MALTVEKLCNQLARLKLVEPAVVRDLRQRWLKEAKNDKANAEKFGKWLVAQKKISDFQWTLLSKGEGQQLYFGPYKLIERIGQGRMAGVFKAVHKLGQTVAIKVLPPSRSNHPQLLARFLREARLAIRLQHPNVVRAFQQGKTNTGLHYIVMEFLDGVSLDDVLKKRKRLSVHEAVHAAAQTFDGLQHIFEEGMVHRDMKPGNLMFLPGAKGKKEPRIVDGIIKILDIGLGRALFDEGAPNVADASELTADGAILGTPSYMAPEQARNPRMVDIRADIYSVGCVVYHMLTGAPPFDDAQFMRQIARHVAEPPAPLKQKVADIPDELQDVVDVLLAKDPAQRYSTPEQAARALRAVPGSDYKQAVAQTPDAAMESYLTWLKDVPEIAAAANADLPAATPPSKPPTPVRQPKAPAPLVNQPAGPIAAAAPAVPFAKAPGVQTIPAAKRPVADPAAEAPMAVRQPSPSVAKPVFGATIENGQQRESTTNQADLASLTKPAEPIRQKLALRSRDIVFAGIGAVLVLVIELVLWAVWMITNWLFLA